MRWFQDWTIGRKCLFFFALIICFSTAAYLYLARTAHLFVHDFNNDNALTRAAIVKSKTAALASLQMANETINYVYSKKPEHWNAKFKADADADQALLEAREQIQRLSNNQTLLALLEKVSKQDNDVCNPLENQTMELAKAGRGRKARLLFETRYIPARKELNRLIDNLNDTLEARGVEADKRVMADASDVARGLRVGWVILAIVLLTSCGLFFVLSRFVNYQIETLQKNGTQMEAQNAELEGQQDELLRANRELHEIKQLFDRCQDLVCIAGYDGYLKRLNPAWERVLGFSEAEMMAQSFLSFVHPEDTEKTLTEVARLTTGSAATLQFETRHRCKDGSYRWLSWDTVSDPQTALLYCAARDISEHKKVVEQQEQLSALIANSTDFISMATLEGIPFYINEGGRKMVGIPNDAHVDKLTLADFFTRETWDDIQDEVFPMIQNEDSWEGELEMRHLVTGSILYTQASIFQIRNPQTGEPMCLATVQRDITTQKQMDDQIQYNIVLIQDQNAELEMQKQELASANAQLLALATIDGLTGLKNHRAFQEKLADEFKRTQRYHTPLSLILLDVDKFKTYNDAYGHPEGDKVLKTVARLMQETARETDYVCRYGGEEFVIVLPDTDAEGATRAAERIRAAIEAQHWPLRPVTASFGVSTLNAEMTAAQELIDRADKALYASKEAGRNRVTHVAELSSMDDTLDLLGDVSLPYSDMLREMLHAEAQTMSTAAERIREALAHAYDATIRSWTQLLDMRDKETEGHSERVTEMMVEMAKHIRMNAEEILYARWGAMLHDVGKMGVPDSILHKAGPLTEEEWEIMRRHPTIAYEMLSPAAFLLPALEIPYCHHEKWDGTGYPRGLKGNDIPIAARLFAVIDVYDALTSDRPYRKAWSKTKTVAHIRSLSGTHFDPRAVKVFLDMLKSRSKRSNPPVAPDLLAA